MIQVFSLDNSTKPFEDKVRLSIQYLKAISQHDFYIPVLTNLQPSQYPQVVMLAMDQGPLPSAPSWIAGFVEMLGNQHICFFDGPLGSEIF
jgi:hypothetical protein